MCIESIKNSQWRNSLTKITIGLCTMGLTASVLAGNSWLSRYETIDKNNIKKTLYSTSSKAAKAVTDSSTTAFDITVSLHNSPAGDDDSSTSNGDEQEKYEEIFKFMADAICEESNGAHLLQKVSIFKNKKHQAKSDIIWGEREWPRANASGFGANGMHIYFGDVFPDGEGPGNDHDMLADPSGAGYTLGHEWGHYVYGLFDEYAGNDPTVTGARSPQTTDIATVPSIMSNQWRASSEGAKWLNHSTSNNIGGVGRTPQGRVYGKSGWDVLVQDTKDDPKSGQKTAQPQRVRYTALDSVAPSATDNWLKEQLPTGQSDCRNSLNIVWVKGDIDMQIVIDRSGSMRGTPITNARQAAKLLVDATAEGSTSLGVVSFSSNETQNSPIQLLSAPAAAIKSQIKSTIDLINASGGTALYDGAAFALNNLQAFQQTSATGAPGVVFVLADGDDGTSSLSELDVISQYQNANIPIFSFGYGGASPTGSLLRLANGTGGKFFSSPTSLGEITDAFLQANANATDTQNLADGSSTVTAGSQTDFNITIDSGIQNVSLFISFDTSIDSISFELRDSAANLVNQVIDCTTLSSGVSCSANIDIATLTAGGSGDWILSAINTGGSDSTVDFNAAGEPSDQGSYNVTVEGATGNSIAYPEPIILTTAITRDNMITGVNVVASITDPFNQVSTFSMVDDGTNGDGISGDGIYSAIIGYNSNGLHQIEVQVDNLSGNASFTTTGILTPRLDGTQPATPPLVAITENFFRVSKTSLIVEGVPLTDGNDSSNTASVLTIDNSETGGQIDQAGDVDFFRADGIDTTSDFVVRVSGLSLGMMPAVTIFGADGNTELITRATLQSNPSTSGYLYIPLPTTQLESTMFVGIEHEDVNVSLGGYQVSAGTPLNTDVPPNTPPVAVADNGTVFIGQTVNISVLSNDSDADGDNLTIDEIRLTTALGTASVNANDVVYDPSTAFDSLAQGDSVNDTFTYIVSDGKGGFTSGDITILVMKNSSPVAADDSGTTNETTVITLDMLANDSDLEGHTLILISTDVSELSGTISDQGNGTVSYDPNGAFSSLEDNQQGTDAFSYVIEDELGAQSTGTVTITINGVSDPVVVVPPKKSSGGSVYWLLPVLFLLATRRRKMVMK
jgi:VCBS repeat-containing protein